MTIEMGSCFQADLLFPELYQNSPPDDMLNLVEVPGFPDCIGIAYRKDFLKRYLKQA